MRFTTLFDRRDKIIAGVIVGLMAWILAFLPTLFGFFESFELKSYDMLCRAFVSDATSPSDIVLVAVDQASLDTALHEGITWPWPRQMYAPIIRFATLSGAKAVIFDILFTEPSSYGVEDDRILAQAIKENGRSCLPLFLSQEKRRPKSWEQSVLKRSAIPVTGPADFEILKNDSLIPPIEILSESSNCFGNVKVFPDADGIYRRIPLFSRYQSDFIPSLGLAAYQNIMDPVPLIISGRNLMIGENVIPADGQNQLLLTFYNPENGFRQYSAFNVISSYLSIMENREPSYPRDVFKDSIIFIGLTAPGLFDMKPTPVRSASPGTVIHATLLSNLIRGDFRYKVPEYGVFLFSAALAILVSVTIMFATGLWFLLLTFLLCGVTVGAIIALAFHWGFWVDGVMPAVTLVCTFVLTSAFSYATEGRQKRQIKQTFSHYMSDHLIQDLLKNPEKLRLGGEKRVLTVFFSDIAGFTEISEKLTPEKVVFLLNTYLTAMSDIILESGGIIDKFEGDAIMAFWGAPLHLKNHAHEACIAALENQARLTILREEFIRMGLPPVYSRIGINTGAMIIGNMGSSRRFDFTVIGDNVNLASRLEGAGKAYGVQIIISEETYLLAKEFVEARELDLIQVKGKERPVRIYELLAKRGKLSEKMKQTMRLFAVGLHHYRDTEWEDALAKFSEALDISPEDSPSRLFIERCRTFMKNPPPAGWKGIHRLTEK
ncbi:MAG: adenylate/guanylate cyclase domain-containing protein [Deltaproteobacteria bacterium]|nr:adenylate/guanylate cyclase domain-containing protein [Deltaproteobacteria bacterium]